MAHPTELKAQTLALLIIGDGTNEIARRLGVPKQTVSRWRAEADQVLDECTLPDSRLAALMELWDALR